MRIEKFGAATLYLGDCAEVMSGFQTAQAHLCVTSPPYDDLRAYGGFTFDFERIAKQLYRMIYSGGVVVWVVGDATHDGSESGTSFKQALFFKDQCGFKLYDTMIYEKINYVPLNNQRYEQAFEYMFVLSKGKPAIFNGFRTLRESRKGVMASATYYNRDGSSRKAGSASDSDDKLLPNIWSYSVGGESVGHPAVFPLKLATDHILSWSNETSTVLDPFMGSGTTGIGALQLKRAFIGIEQNEKFFDISCRRIEEASKQETLF
jgi:DNA modification methylase